MRYVLSYNLGSDKSRIFESGHQKFFAEFLPKFCGGLTQKSGLSVSVEFPSVTPKKRIMENAYCNAHFRKNTHFLKVFWA